MEQYANNYIMCVYYNISVMIAAYVVQNSLRKYLCQYYFYRISSISIITLPSAWIAWATPAILRETS